MAEKEVDNRSSVVAPKKKRYLKRKTREGLVGYLFASPWLLGFLAFTLFPLCTSFYYSFTNYNLVDTPTFVGFANYTYLLTQDLFFWESLGNTMFQVFFGTIFSIIMGLLAAIILSKPIKGIGIWRTIFYLPMCVSSVAMALVWTWMFNEDYGLINQFFEIFNIPGVDWLGDEHVVKISLILMSAWGSGITALFFLGAMKSIPNYLYEAADIAGVGKTRQFYTITLPLITPTMLFMLITSVIANFQYFTMAYLMVGRGTNYSAYYLAYYLYDKAFTDNQMGYASAISWILFLIVIVFVWAIFKSSKKWVHYMGGE
jgi:multiple sugar transport system permease protein